MPSPFDLGDFQEMTIMTVDDVQAVIAKKPGYLEARGEAHWSIMMARLRKRYDVAQMETDPVDALWVWWTALLTRDAYRARGFDPSAKDDEESIIDAAKEAEAALLEAANSRDGLYDLPVHKSSTASGVSKGGPQSYSETSPYTWMNIQERGGRGEDGM